jgi:hypothetical protein
VVCSPPPGPHAGTRRRRATAAGGTVTVFSMIS